MNLISSNNPLYSNLCTVIMKDYNFAYKLQHPRKLPVPIDERSTFDDYNIKCDRIVEANRFYAMLVFFLSTLCIIHCLVNIWFILIKRRKYKNFWLSVFYVTGLMAVTGRSTYNIFFLRGDYFGKVYRVDVALNFTI